MNAISGCLRSAGRTFSEAELRVVTEVVANGDGRSRAQLMVQVCASGCSGAARAAP